MQAPSIYDSLISTLRSHGYWADLPSEGHEPRVICASRREGDLARGNSFWVTFRSTCWYLVTWAPTYYQFAEEQSLVLACLEFLRTEPRTQPRLPEQIVSTFHAIEVTEDAFSAS